jgi:hypothetical protein
MPEVPIIQEARICPITTVQDSIDALALSLFEALRGIRDATVASSSSSSSLSMSAYQEEEEEEDDEQRQIVIQQQISALLENHASKEDGSRTGGDNSSSSNSNNIDNEAIRLAKLRLLHGLNVNYFSQRAYDTNNPDYESFLIAYLSEDKYAKELIDMMHNSTTTISNKTTTKKDEEVSSSSSSIANSEVVKSVKASSDATTTKKTKLSIKLNVSSSKQQQQQQQLLPKHDIIESTNTSSGSSSSNSSNGIVFPRNQKEYVQLLHSSQLSHDTCITHDLAKNVLCKSNTIDTLVANLPGMDRNRSTQLQRIHELITLNQQLSHELEVAYGIANDRREEIRCALRENTCLALGIEEEE